MKITILISSLIIISCIIFYIFFGIYYSLLIFLFGLLILTFYYCFLLHIKIYDLNESFLLEKKRNELDIKNITKSINDLVKQYNNINYFLKKKYSKMIKK